MKLPWRTSGKRLFATLSILAHAHSFVRDLADIRKEGKLTRDEFAVAMHLINVKLSGQEIPTSLPVSLVPPSLREEYGPGKQEVLQSSATKDLFDLFADEPPASKAASPAPQAPAQAQAPTRAPVPAPAPQIGRAHV